MTNVSKNSLDLIESAGKSLKGKFGKAFLATLILVAPIMACIFSVYLIPVAMLLYGVVQTGYIRYMRDLLDNKQPSLKSIFGEFTNPGLEILLGVLLVSMFLVGGLLLIFPGLVLVGFYSMSLYFAENKKSETPFEAMKTCRKHMRVNVTNMFSFKVLFWLAYVVLIIIAAGLAIFAINLWAEYKLVSILVGMGNFIFTTGLWALVSTYYNATAELFFRELLVHDDATAEQTVVADEVKEEPVQEVVEEVKVAPVKKSATTKKAPAKSTTKTAAKTSTKATTKSTAAKSTTATKAASTTTAKKTTAAKTTTAKTTSAKAPAKKATTTKTAAKTTTKKTTK